jgi:hypothetical protein
MKTIENNTSATKNQRKLNSTAACNRQQHKLNKTVPPLSAEDLCRLRDDLKINGLKVPIVLYEGKVLDGWHRHNICMEFNIPMRFENYSGDCPQLHCFSLNVARRHLQPPQLAALAVELLPSFEKDAKIRQLATLKQFASKTSVRDVKNGTTDETAITDKKPPMVSSGKSRSLLSQQLGVSTGYIQRAKKIKETAPHLFEDLKRGTKTFQDVKREIYQTTEAKLKDTTSVPLRKNDEQCSLQICDLADAAITSSVMTRSFVIGLDEMADASRQKNTQAKELLLATILEAIFRTIYNRPFQEGKSDPPRSKKFEMERFRKEFFSDKWTNHCSKALELHSKLRHRNAHPDCPSMLAIHPSLMHCHTDRDDKS